MIMMYKNVLSLFLILVSCLYGMIQPIMIHANRIQITGA